jgi:hypothetical protein
MDHQAGQKGGLSTGSQIGSQGSEPLHIWRPRPLVRAIEWSPTDAGVVGDRAAYEVFVMQDTLTELLKRLYVNASAAQFGFMVGDLCECPESGIRYVLVTSTIAARNRFDEDGSPQIPAEAYVAMQLKLDRRVGGLVGWYHVHPNADVVHMSENDVATHGRYFADPWQSALIVAPSTTGPRAGLFRAGRDGFAPEVLRPFHEVLSARSFVARGVRHTCVNWRNYVTDGDTVLLPYEAGDGTIEPAAAIVDGAITPVEPPAAEDESNAADSLHIPLPDDPALTEAVAELSESDLPPASTPAEPPEPRQATHPAGSSRMVDDFADLQEAAPRSPDWTGGEHQEQLSGTEDPIYPPERGQSIDRLADRQGDLPDQRLANMRRAYPAPESESKSPGADAVIDEAPEQTLPGTSVEKVVGEKPAVEARASADRKAATRPSRRRRKKRRATPSTLPVSRRTIGMAAAAVVVIGAAGFAALKLPTIMGGDQSSATPSSQTGAPGAVAAADDGGGSAADAASLGAVSLGSAGPDGMAPVSELAGGASGAGQGGDDPAESGQQLAANADAPTGGPSVPVAGESEVPASVADEVVRLAKPLPDRAYAAPVLAIDGTVVELNDERARAAAQSRRATEQATAGSTSRARIRTMQRPVVTAPVQLDDDPGVTQVSIDRPELLQKLDRLSDSLSSALNGYFAQALAYQNDDASCDDVTRAFREVDDAWSAYNSTLGSPRVVTFEGARAARDVQLSERFGEVQGNYSDLDCGR